MPSYVPLDLAWELTNSKLVGYGQASDVKCFVSSSRLDVGDAAAEEIDICGAGRWYVWPKISRTKWGIP